MMTEQELEEWAGAVSQRMDDYDVKLDQIRMGLAKMILGMSGQPVTIDIEKDLGIKLPREVPLILPGVTRQ